MSEYVKAWQCVGCGRLEAAQTCLGVCQDRRVEMVYASQYEAALAEASGAREEASRLAAFLRRFIATTPRNDSWERTYRAMQAQARDLLARSPD
jgi:hypothetical protein